MDIHVETADRNTRRFRDVVASRLRHALRRMGWLVSAARAKLSHTPSAAPADKRCEIVIVSRVRTVRVASFAPTWPLAMELALARARGTTLRLAKRPVQRLPYRPRPLLTHRG